MASYQKVHNAQAAHASKLDLRQYALDFVGKTEANVFDGFAGRGEMYRGAWSEAARYVGCDATWDFHDPGRRFVGDNRLVLRGIDLRPFNVFDFDAFGSPWEQMLILAARRPWGKGERGAVILTDGSSLQLRYGQASGAIMQLLGLRQKSLPPKLSTGETMHQAALRAWSSLARVVVAKMWRAEGNGSGKAASVRMLYTALAIEGVG